MEHTSEGLGLTSEGTDEPELDSEDEKWLDDVFGADETSTNAPSDQSSAPEDLQQETPGIEDSVSLPDKIDDDISDLAADIGNGSPSLMELQDATAGAMVAALTPQVGNVGADWIRSDDDIIPTRSKGLRRSKKLEIAPAISLAVPVDVAHGSSEPAPAATGAQDLAEDTDTHDVLDSALAVDAPSAAPSHDAIAMFSPVDDNAEKKAGRFARKGRKSKKSNVESGHTEPDTLDAGDAVRGLAEVIASSEPEPIDENDVTFVAAAPLIADAGLPATPETVDPEPIVDDGTVEDAAEAPKKRRLQLTRKKKQKNDAESD